MNELNISLLKSLVRSKHGYTNERGCWLINNTNDWSHYSNCKYRNKTVPLHRLSAAAFLKLNLNSELDVLHKCDVKGCFNPEHLFVGTQSDNKKDYITKRRYLVKQAFGLFKKDLIENLEQRLASL